MSAEAWDVCGTNRHLKVEFGGRHVCQTALTDMPPAIGDIEVSSHLQTAVRRLPSKHRDLHPCVAVACDRQTDRPRVGPHQRSRHPPPGGQNITEWCKKELCWEQFRDVEIAVPADVEQLLATRAERGPKSSNHTLDEQTTSQDELIIARVAAIATETWFSLSAWAADTQSLQPWQRGLSFSLGRLASQGKHPTRKQAMHGEKILSEARGLGVRG